MAKSRKKKGGGADVAVIDFSKMEESEGGGKRYKEGDYVGRIASAKRDVSSEKGSPCIKVVLQFTEGRYKGKKITERLWLSPKALPRLVDMLEILGVKVPKKEVQLPLKKLVGKEIGFSLEDEEYDEKIRSRVSWDFLDPDDVRESDDDDDDDELDIDDDDDDDLDPDDEDDEDDEDDDDDDDDDEDDDDVDLDDMDRAELKAYIKDNDLDVKVTKKMKEAKIRKLIEAAESDDDDDDEDDDDDLESLDLDDL